MENSARLTTGCIAAVTFADLDKTALGWNTLRTPFVPRPCKGSSVRLDDYRGVTKDTSYIDSHCVCLLLNYKLYCWRLSLPVSSHSPAASFYSKIPPFALLAGLQTFLPFRFFRRVKPPRGETHDAGTHCPSLNCNPIPFSDKVVNERCQHVRSILLRPMTTSLDEIQSNRASNSRFHTSCSFFRHPCVV